MIDLNKTIADLLKPVARIELAFPNAKSSFPVISLLELENTSNVILNGADRLSGVVFQIDVWCKTAEEAENLAIEVNNIMIQAGFKRISGFKPNENNIHRKCLRYGANIDEINNRVYSR